MDDSLRPEYVYLADPTDTDSIVYEMAFQMPEMVVYNPLGKVATLASSVPRYVVFKGTDSLFNLITDVQLWRDQTSTGFNSVYLDSFYSNVNAMAQYLFDSDDGRDIIMIGHSLGGTYAINVFAKLLRSYPTTAAHVHRVHTFNPYVLVDNAWKELKASPEDVRQRITHHIIEGDFASAIARTEEAGNVVMFGAPSTTHEGNGYVTFNTLREFLLSTAPTVTRDAWNSLDAHKMSNWTTDTPGELEAVIPVRPGNSAIATNHDIYIHTAYKHTLPHFNHYAPAALYVAPNAGLDMALTDDPGPGFLITASIPDNTKWTVTQTGTIDGPNSSKPRYIITWVMSMSHANTANTNLAVKATWSSNATGSGTPSFVLHPAHPSDGVWKISDMKWGQRTVFPIPLEYVAASAVSPSGLTAYEFVFQDASQYNHTRRGITPTWLNGTMNQTIGFEFIVDYDWVDAIPIQMALCDTGGGLLKWGHIAIGDIDDYNIQIPHKSGDEYFVHSNTYDPTTAMYTPCYEIVHWDTGRYSIKSTDTINNGKYLKRPGSIPLDWDFTQNKTRFMIANNNRNDFIDMEWADWDPFHDSPTHFVFTIAPFADIKIKDLGDSIDNSVNGVITPTWMLYPQFIRSPNGQYTFSIERTGQGVLSSATQPYIWRTTTDIHGNGIYLAPNGDLVTYTPGTLTDTDAPFTWVSGTQEHPANIVTGSNYRKMTVTDTGAFQILDMNGNVLVQHS